MTLMVPKIGNDEIARLIFNNAELFIDELRVVADTTHIPSLPFIKKPEDLSHIDHEGYIKMLKANYEPEHANYLIRDFNFWVKMRKESQMRSFSFDTIYYMLIEGIYGFSESKNWNFV